MRMTFWDSPMGSGRNALQAETANVSTRNAKRCLTQVAVGSAIADRPPRRSVRAALPHTAPTSDMWRRIAFPSRLYAHQPSPVTRLCRPVPGACGPDSCSPWLASFPPPSPPLRPVAPSLCSRGSTVSGRRRRACALASVRRSNCTCGFPACSFHEDVFF